MCVCGLLVKRQVEVLELYLLRHPTAERGNGGREQDKKEEEEKKVTAQMKDSDRNSWTQTERSRGIDGGD